MATTENWHSVLDLTSIPPAMAGWILVKVQMPTAGVRLALNVGGAEGDLPEADSDGNFSFSETYTVDPLAVGSDLEDRVVVLHGLSDGEEYVATLPIACSLIVPADSEAFAADDLDGQTKYRKGRSQTAPAMRCSGTTRLASVVYYMLVVNDVDDLTAAHIHMGGSGENGGVVAFLFSQDRMQIQLQPLASSALAESPPMISSVTSKA